MAAQAVQIKVEAMIRTTKTKNLDPKEAIMCINTSAGIQRDTALDLKGSAWLTLEDTDGLKVVLERIRHPELGFQL